MAAEDCRLSRLRGTIMAHHSHFVIRNNLSKPLTLNIEPEGAFFPLNKGEEVSVTDVFTVAPVTLLFTNSDKEDTIVSLWPGDGELRVEKDGVDVFDLLQNGVDARSVG
jgi:hypothetical protein